MEISKRLDNVIIVGGGVAGLMAAMELLKKGLMVTILEASNRLGGRINTIHDSAFSRPVEKSVEFIHGHLPVTLSLLKEAGVYYEPVRGEMLRVVDGEWRTQEDFAVGWDDVMEKMNELRDDMTLVEFLTSFFGDEKYADVRKSVLRFAQGFDLADPSRASVLALREEWMGEEGSQYRIPGGYDQLVIYLAKRCVELGCIIHFSNRVDEIKWDHDYVTVISGHENYHANKVIVTVPIGILQSGQINFVPGIPTYSEAFHNVGFGTVIKVLLEFNEPFWESLQKNIGFILSGESIPTWWTQSPGSFPLLTGWVGGTQAHLLTEKSNEEIFQLALQSLSNIFKKTKQEIQQSVRASLIANWARDPFTLGAYSYNLVNWTNTLKLLNTPLKDTLYFAGEALYQGSSPGTVEAALVSGRQVAGKVLKME